MKKYKYYFKSNSSIPSLKTLRRNFKASSLSYGIEKAFLIRKEARKEVRQQVWIDLVQYIISIPQQNVILFYLYLQTKIYKYRWGYLEQ